MHIFSFFFPLILTLQHISPIFPHGIFLVNALYRIKFGDIYMECPKQLPESLGGNTAKGHICQKLPSTQPMTQITLHLAYSVMYKQNNNHGRHIFIVWPQGQPNILSLAYSTSFGTIVNNIHFFLKNASCRTLYKVIKFSQMPSKTQELGKSLDSKFDPQSLIWRMEA